MEAKPPGWHERYGAVFADGDVAAAYRLRPAYPDETLATLVRLAGGGRVLDAGCGTGELARRLAPHVEHVDAVDVSAAMLAEARTSPGGDAANVRWLGGRIEDVHLEPPYALVTAGDSVHWFDWRVAMPRFRTLLGSDGLLAIVQRDWLRDQRLRERLRPIYGRHSINRDFAPLDPVGELERRGLFVREGESVSAPSPWSPTLAELVEGHFSMSGFARARMRDPDIFADEVREAVAATLRATDGRYSLDVVGTVIWGRPA